MQDFNWLQGVNVISCQGVELFIPTKKNEFLSEIGIFLVWLQFEVLVWSQFELFSYATI